MKKIIKKLNEGIETCEIRGENMDGSSFDELEGVVISANEARLIVRWLKVLKSLMMLLNSLKER